MKTRITLTIILSLSINFIFSQSNNIVNYYDTIAVGVAKHDNKEYKAAIQEYIRVPESDTNYITAITEIMLSYYALEEYNKAIDLGIKVLNNKHDVSSSFFLNLGSALDNAKRYKEAVKYYKIGLEMYPKNHIIYYNMGYSYQMLEDYKKAMECYKTSIELNPFYDKAHYQMAQLALNEGKTTLAILALNTYLIVRPNGSFSNTVLSQLNKICSSKYKENYKSKGLDVEQGEDYSEIDLLVENYLALDKKYKVKSKIQLPFVKQSHLVFEKMLEQEESDKFWYRTYVPVFKAILESGKFEIYSYYIAQSSGGKKHQKIIASKEAKIKDFVNWLISVMDNSHREYHLPFPKSKFKDISVYRANARFAVSFITHKDKDGKNIGYAESYYANGRLKDIIHYNENGEEEGLKTYYYPNGKIKEKDYLVKGVLQDSAILFNKYERRKTFYSVKDGAIAGKIIYYNNTGSKSTELTIFDSKKQGEKLRFYESGKFYSRINFVDNKAHGKYESFFNSGEKKEVVNYVDDKLSGTDTIFFRNGEIRILQNFEDGELNGEFIRYYKNGKISEKGKYLNGNIVGKFVSYNDDGTIDSETNYDETGKKNGSYIEYYDDGKPYFELGYRKGEVVSYKYYNEDGSVMKEAKRRMGNFAFEGHHQNGIISSTGNYGKKEHLGEWRYYDKNGTLYLVENYNKGTLEGKTNRYYPNGDVRTIENYVNGKDEGVYVRYTPFKTIERKGYFKDGESIALWKYYYNNGDLKETKYFLNGNVDGFDNQYAPNQKLYKRIKFEDGVIAAEWRYDEDGNITDSAYYKNGSGDLKVYFKDKKQVKLSYKLHYNTINGAYNTYYPNGNKSIVGEYFDGYKNGKWTYYFINGKVSKEKYFYYGDNTGVWKEYYPNGKLRTKKEYKDDELNGKYITYFDNGKIQMERTYKNGELAGETKYYNYTGAYDHSRYYKDDILIAYSYKTASGIKKVPVEKETAHIKTYYSNGKLSREFTIDKGWLVGDYKKYYPSGKIYQELSFVNDEYNGKHLTYYPTGKKKKEFNYINGDLEGTANFYYSNGKMKTSYEYLHGYLHGPSKEYDKTGKLIHHYIYYYGDLEEIIK